MPVRVYQANKDQPVQAKLAYSMTLFKLHTSYSRHDWGPVRKRTIEHDKAYVEAESRVPVAIIVTKSTPISA